MRATSERWYQALLSVFSDGARRGCSGVGLPQRLIVDAASLERRRPVAAAGLLRPDCVLLAVDFLDMGVGSTPTMMKRSRNKTFGRRNWSESGPQKRMERHSRSLRGRPRCQNDRRHNVAQREQLERFLQRPRVLAVLPGMAESVCWQRERDSERAKNRYTQCNPPFPLCGQQRGCWSGEGSRGGCMPVPLGLAREDNGGEGGGSIVVRCWWAWWA